ncbi:MAG: NAD-dependent epimerase/dehydratase family protein [Phycisphaerales bacterium]|nr:MAG: NAD-dependent epimerase/dehydratase family protein [Phycisphaerales bacterium]
MNKTKVGITGIDGFVGSHLKDRLLREENVDALAFEDSYFEEFEKLKSFTENCDVLVHLAAMNRGDQEQLYKVNVSLVEKLIDALRQTDSRPHVIFSSSVQCELDNPYGRSKKEGARLLSRWARANGAPLSILIIPNVFGDQGKPFYNSVVATFCHQLTHDLQPKVRADKEIGLIYINELVEKICEVIKSPPRAIDSVEMPPEKRIMVSEILAKLNRFKEMYYDKSIVPDLEAGFEQQLYNTFLTYMEDSDYQRFPMLHCDDRGTLFEVVKQEDGGQVFFSTTEPGVTRGNHYHTRKMEKFCVVKGNAVIRLRRIGTDQVIEYNVSGSKPASIEMPIFYTHSIENVGTEELLTLFWTNEFFDKNDPDTFYESVLTEKK